MTVCPVGLAGKANQVTKETSVNLAGEVTTDDLVHLDLKDHLAYVYEHLLFGHRRSLGVLIIDTA